MHTDKEDNLAILCGTVEGAPEYDHTLYGEDFYRGFLSVPRLSGTVDSLPLMLPERMKPLPEAGACLRVGGQLRSYKKQYESGNRLMVTVFVKDCEPGDVPENHIELFGYLCKPAVFRTTPFLREITDLMLAVNRAYGKSDYLPCIAWGKNARMARDIVVGDPVHVSGRLQSRAYVKTLPDGNTYTRVAYEVSCSTIEKL